MTRKDSEKDSERPHYYSQFWLDVAAGRRVIGAPKSDEGTEVAEPETPEPMILRKSGRNNISDGYADTYSRAGVEPPPEEVIEPESEPELEPDEFELADEVDDLDLPNILVDDALDEAAEDTELADMDADFVPAEEEEEDFYDEEEEEEEDEDWPIGRGRKKPKPGRQTKPPKPPQKKPPRRDARRGGY